MATSDRITMVMMIKTICIINEPNNNIFICNFINYQYFVCHKLMIILMLFYFIVKCTTTTIAGSSFSATVLKKKGMRSRRTTKRFARLGMASE
jgi:hypothetical protein